ncbi:MAG: HypC/HybG/HupF family hydrogenase formation chaperone [Candidatus Altiarchaeota archaeon]|nr:HypC/HybG/HupF family hydrogenase formation chaperone [Candidatus Altiarchaeota archaeon]
MCLAEPLKVVGVKGKNAKVHVNGVARTVDASLLRGLKEGDYILLHDQLAIQKLDPRDTQETIKQITDLGLS